MPMQVFFIEKTDSGYRVAWMMLHRFRVAMVKKIRAEIRQETEGMTDEEIREYFRLAGERQALRWKAHARRQAAKNQT
jgi:hypothetical protein